MSMQEQSLIPKNETLLVDPVEVGKYYMELLERTELVEESSYEGPYSHLKESLNERIVGQDDAIDAVVNSLNREEFRDTSKPIGTFTFLGPTGVGKSQVLR